MAFDKTKWDEIVKQDANSIVNELRKLPNAQDQIDALTYVISHTDLYAKKKAAILEHESGFLASLFGGKREFSAAYLAMLFGKALSDANNDQTPIVEAFKALSFRTQLRMLTNDAMGSDAKKNFLIA